jgi:hypothetical protein
MGCLLGPSFETPAARAPQDEEKASSARPVVSDAGASSSLFRPPGRNPEGAERREAHQQSTPFSVGALAGKFTQSAQTMPKGTRLAALHTHTSLRRVRAFKRRLCTPGPCFRPLDGGLFALPSRAAFAAPRPCPSSHSRQPHVVGADGYPGRPGRMLARHPRGRRTPLRLVGAPRRRPRLSGAGV